MGILCNMTKNKLGTSLSNTHGDYNGDYADRCAWVEKPCHGAYFINKDHPLLILAYITTCVRDSRCIRVPFFWYNTIMQIFGSDGPPERENGRPLPRVTAS